MQPIHNGGRVYHVMAVSTSTSFLKNGLEMQWSKHSCFSQEYCSSWIVGKQTISKCWPFSSLTEVAETPTTYTQQCGSHDDCRHTEALQDKSGHWGGGWWFQGMDDDCMWGSASMLSHISCLEGGQSRKNFLLSGMSTLYTYQHCYTSNRWTSLGKELWRNTIRSNTNIIRAPKVPLYCI